MVVLERILGSWSKAALSCSGLALLFFSYGHVYPLIKNWTIGSILIGRHRFLFPLWVLFTVLWIWFVAKKVARPESWSRLLNGVSVATLILPVASMLSYAIQANSEVSVQGIQPRDLKQSQLVSSEEYPDIYYIILDGYAREDLLSELYEYDNSDFLNALRNLGFFIADRSRSNYIQTDLSLSSSLNMIYLDFLPETRGKNARDRTPLAKMIKENQVIDFLRHYDYQVVAFHTGYGPTILNSADVFWDSSTDFEEIPEENRTAASLNAFESLLLRSSAAVVLMDIPMLGRKFGLIAPEEPLYSEHRIRILYNLKKLKQVPEMQGSFFVFAHIIAPHPPFVFGANGEWITPTGPYSLAREGVRFTGSPEEYIRGYREQLNYLNTILLDTISTILELSETPPMIIVQGDHGPGAFLDQESIENSNLQERLSILNGYYFPDESTSGLYPTISPVNSFRMVFNRIFHEEFALLEDESYFSTIEEPFNFILVPE
jgi:hypothetical protein